MLIIASDYDGTLYSHGELLGPVGPAVTAWRKTGNRFGIATGRDFSMIRPEIEQWKIPVDFIVCINGAAVYNHDYTLLESHLLDDALVPRILLHPAGDASLHYQLSGLEPLRVFLRAGSLFWDAGIKYESISVEQALAAKDIGQVSLAYKTEAESEKWTSAINTDLGDHVHAHRNKRTIDITRKDVNKAVGVASVLKAKNWPAENVRAIGDGTNDVPMISAYQGFSVKGASEDAVLAATRHYENVPSLLADLGAEFTGL